MYHIQKTLLTERIILISLTLVAFATRFYRLSHPDAVVFDELHFGNFLERHLRNEVCHPPQQYHPSSLLTHTVFL